MRLRLVRGTIFTTSTAMEQNTELAWEAVENERDVDRNAARGLGVDS